MLPEFTVHQGVIASCRDELLSQDSLPAQCRRAGERFLGLVLDQVQDPHNLGACLRSAACAEVDVVVMPKRGAVSVNATVRKVASGGAELTPVAEVVNVARALETLKSCGVWVYGTDVQASRTIYDVDFRRPVALVMGGEAKGLRPLVAQHCDEVVRIPSASAFQSLNISVACGICLFEIMRQRGEVA